MVRPANLRRLPNLPPNLRPLPAMAIGNSMSDARSSELSSSTPQKRPRIFPLKINYKADILTVITFLMSFAALLWQVVNYLQGAAVRVFAPDQIIIAASDKVDFPNREGGPYVHFLARMSYVNEGSVGYNATIRRERIEISIADVLQLEQYWYRFVSSDATGPQGTTLVVSKISDFHPFGLQAGSAESHLTLFQPWPKKCAVTEKNCKWDVNYMSWENFFKLVKPGQKVKVRLLADEFVTASPVTAECTATLNSQSYSNLEERRWDSPVCR